MKTPAWQDFNPFGSAEGWVLGFNNHGVEYKTENFLTDVWLLNMQDLLYGINCTIARVKSQKTSSPLEINWLSSLITVLIF